MWISKKRWNALEKRVADLEVRVQSQPEKVNLEFLKSCVSEALHQFQEPPPVLKVPSSFEQLFVKK